jgi:hypothetical protein
MNKPELFSETNEATYCPEDNKLRLYVGRVPRDEYEALRAEGWTSTPKQTCDFVATWTPGREETAISYAGIIGDEDISPAERSADRAERFTGYLGKRLGEATESADEYESGPAVHGHQNAARAERAAARHDRKALLALNSWSKAEYWERRTAGVISHCLYKDRPGVRMGRIKRLEAEQRKEERHAAEYARNYYAWVEIRNMTDPVAQKAAAIAQAGSSHGGGYEYKHPRPDEVTNEHVKNHGTSIYSLLTLSEREFGVDITGAEAAAMWLDGAREPDESRWSLHFKLRLAYENQMLAAQGGTLEQKDVEPGGKIANQLVIKVSKSPVTKRVTSCSLLGPRVEGWAYKIHNIPGTEWAEYVTDLERVKPGLYVEPTEESLKELEDVKAKIKAAKADVVPKAPPLINPAELDAEKLQAILNERNKRWYPTPAKVLKLTMEQSKRYRAETKGIADDGQIAGRTDVIACRVRLISDSGDRVVIITDKPCKNLPISWKPDHKRAWREALDRCGTSNLDYYVHALGGDRSKFKQHAGHAELLEYCLELLNAMTDEQAIESRKKVANR